MHAVCCLLFLFPSPPFSEMSVCDANSGGVKCSSCGTSDHLVTLCTSVLSVLMDRMLLNI